jgi:hypothetical protein
MAELTSTERAAEFGLARRHLAEIYRLKVCGACQNRLTNWGGCQYERTYPHCMNTPGNRFELDRTRLQGA